MSACESAPRKPDKSLVTSVSWVMLWSSSGVVDKREFTLDN